MCGRFTLFEADTILLKEFGAPISFGLTPRYNIAPSQQILAVRPSTGKGGREAAFLRWGLIPHWAKDPSIGNRMINARAETVAEKPAFRNAFRKQRCLIPADGFFEWQKLDRKKQPFYIRMRDRRPFAFAGLWERWEAPGSEIIETCTILTTEANDVLKPLHDRMPVILPLSGHDLWLDPGILEQDRLKPLFYPYPDREMEAFPVGVIVNNPKIDDSRCISPVNPE
jgi:putative SOS response-associated peptidase YedK